MGDYGPPKSPSSNERLNGILSESCNATFNQGEPCFIEAEKAVGMKTSQKIIHNNSEIIDINCTITQATLKSLRRRGIIKVWVYKK
jgi:hypothetical protein